MALVSLVAFAGCSSSPSGSTSGQTDGGDARGTRGHDAGKDAGRDARDGAHDAAALLPDVGAGIPGGTCTPNVVETCGCSAGTGSKRCLSDGRMFGPCTCATYGLEIAVATTGDDSAAGTLAAPFLTLERAQVAARAAVQGGAPSGGVVVWIRGGVYPRTAPFALTSADSGGTAAPVVYRAYPGETVRILGGTTLMPSSFAPVTSASPVWSRIDPRAQGSVLSLHLPDAGVTDLGMLQARGFGLSSAPPSALELFIGGQRMPLARWPDQDENTGPKGGTPDDAGVTVGFTHLVTATSPTTFDVPDGRAARWMQATASDVWFHGFWCFPWADSHINAASIDGAAGTVTLSQTPTFCLNPAQSGGSVYAYNLLEELTQPGEWYVDRSSSILYLWPPSGFATSDVVVSVMETPLVTVNGASNVTFQELSFEAGRTTLVDVEGSTNVTLVGCTLKDSGGVGAVINGGTKSGVDSALIYATADDGVDVRGGDRPSLTQGANFVENSHIHDFGQWDYCYRPAVSVSGDGNVASHNLLHTSPHAAILYGGSEHTIAFNEIHDVCTYSSDSGAIYGGRDWGARGNVIQNNLLHDIWTANGGGSAAFGAHGIYLDDCLSGVSVFGNILYAISGNGIEHGGGRDDLMTNNLLVRCGVGLAADARCTTPGTVTNTPGDSWNLLQKLEVVNYQKAPWAQTYPACAAIPDSFGAITGSHWLAPEGSTFSRNLGFADGQFTTGASAMASYADTTNNVADQDPMFVSPDAGDFHLKAGSPVSSIPGFQAIPVDQIGVQP